MLGSCAADDLTAVRSMRVVMKWMLHYDAECSIILSAPCVAFL